MNDGAAGGPALPRGAVGAWWAQGVRSIFFRRVDWQGLVLSPAVLVVLWLVPMLWRVLIERIAIDGPADFFWPSLFGTGWLALALWLLVAWLLVGGKPATAPPPHHPLFLVALLYAQALPLGLINGTVLVPLMRNGSFSEGDELQMLSQGLWTLALLWVLAAQGVAIWRASVQPGHRRAAALAAVFAITLAQTWLQPPRHWYPARPAVQAEDPRTTFRLTQEVFEAQGRRLDHDLQALAPQRPGQIDVYAITYAPDADEAVFSRESALVAGVMEERFDAAGRTLQLVSRRDQIPRHAWATPLNLRRAIAHVAAQMDPEEDVLFLHLTSHGARNGELASAFWPLSVDTLTPTELKTWLDEAGIRHRVVSVSACYSGSWIAPLEGDGALVMTAADAEHTSYGCGRRSQLTYFGRAMFGEQLRRTRDFEAAHAEARLAIERREKQAGKQDGFSNPQIAVGASMKATLQRLLRQLEGR